MKVLLIDHDDSFTENLHHWLRPSFADITVVHHTTLTKLNFSSHPSSPTLVVISPGPNNPQSYPLTLSWLQQAHPQLFVFGICLGMQIMAALSGVKVFTYSPPKHGKKSKLELNQNYPQLFNEFQGISVARYHSLRVDDTIGDHFQIIATSQDDRIPMWIQHHTKPWLAYQFHPESFLTEKSDLFLKNLTTWIQNQMHTMQMDTNPPDKLRGSGVN